MNVHYTGWAMIAVSILVVLGGIYAVVERDRARPGEEIVEAAQAKVAQADLRLSAARSTPVLPPLDISWTLMNFMLDRCGIAISPTARDQATTGYAYQGPVPAWYGILNGDPMPVLACLVYLQKELPIAVGEVAFNAQSAQAKIAMLGILEAPTP